MSTSDAGEPATEPVRLALTGIIHSPLVDRAGGRLGRVDDVIVASFSDSAIRAFRELSPATPTSAATLETAEFFRAVHQGEDLPALGVVAFQVPETYGVVTLVDGAFVEAAHGAGIAVHVWTVNDEASMRRLIDIGVDGIFTDRPSLLRTVLEGTSSKPGREPSGGGA